MLWVSCGYVKCMMQACCRFAVGVRRLCGGIVGVCSACVVGWCGYVDGMFWVCRNFFRPCCCFDVAMLSECCAYVLGMWCVT